MPVVSWTAQEHLALWLDPRETIAFGKGRVALHALLRSASLSPGDEVLIPGFTCVVVPAAVTYLGLRPVFYDVDPSTANGCPGDAYRKVTPRTRALVVQHTFGTMSDPTAFEELARTHDLLLIEDCAHAIGATHADRPAGSIGHGAFTSVQWSKVASCGLGGIARFNDPELRSAFEGFRAEYTEPSFLRQAILDALYFTRAALGHPQLFWMAQDTYRSLVGAGALPGSSSPAELRDPREPDGYRTLFGRNRRRNVRSALSRLHENLEHRQARARLIRDRLQREGAWIQEIPSCSRSAHLRVPTLVENRTELLEIARRHRIELGDWFDSPLHPREAERSAFGYVEGSCPVGEYLSERMINVPTHEGLDERELTRIVDFVLSHGQLSLRYRSASIA